MRALSGFGTILAASPVRAQTYDPRYPVCLQSCVLGAARSSVTTSRWRNAPHLRQAARLNATLMSPTGDAHFCIVHNRTDRGFCIELTFEATELPDRFEFSFDGFRTIYTCRTVWREDNVAGVSIEGPPPETPESRRARLES
jgi:hypothetical protein